MQSPEKQVSPWTRTPEALSSSKQRARGISKVQDNPRGVLGWRRKTGKGLVCRDADILPLLPPPTPPQALEKISCYRILLTTSIAPPRRLPPAPRQWIKGDKNMPPMPEGGGGRGGRRGRVNGRHRQKPLQVNQTSGTGAPSPTPHPTPPHPSPAPARPSRSRCSAGS